MLVEQRAVEAFDNPVGLRPLHVGVPVLDPLQLEEQLVGVAVGSTAELPAIVTEHGLDGDALRLEGRQHVGVERMHGGERHLVGVEPAPGKREQQSITLCR